MINYKKEMLDIASSVDDKKFLYCFLFSNNEFFIRYTDFSFIFSSNFSTMRVMYNNEYCEIFLTPFAPQRLHEYIIFSLEFYNRYLSNSPILSEVFLSPNQCFSSSSPISKLTWHIDSSSDIHKGIKSYDSLSLSSIQQFNNIFSIHYPIFLKKKDDQNYLYYKMDQCFLNNQYPLCWHDLISQIRSNNLTSTDSINLTTPLHSLMDSVVYLENCQTVTLSHQLTISHSQLHKNYNSYSLPSLFPRIICSPTLIIYIDYSVHIISLLSLQDYSFFEMNHHDHTKFFLENQKNNQMTILDINLPSFNLIYQLDIKFFSEILLQLYPILSVPYNKPKNTKTISENKKKLTGQIWLCHIGQFFLFYPYLYAHFYDLTICTYHILTYQYNLILKDGTALTFIHKGGRIDGRKDLTEYIQSIITVLRLFYPPSPILESDLIPTSSSSTNHVSFSSLSQKLSLQLFSLDKLKDQLFVTKESITNILSPNLTQYTFV